MRLNPDIFPGVDLSKYHFIGIGAPVVGTEYLKTRRVEDAQLWVAEENQSRPFIADPQISIKRDIPQAPKGEGSLSIFQETVKGDKDPETVLERLTGRVNEVGIWVPGEEVGLKTTHESLIKYPLCAIQFFDNTILLVFLQFSSAEKLEPGANFDMTNLQKYRLEDLINDRQQFPRNTIVSHIRQRGSAWVKFTFYLNTKRH